MFIFFNWQGTRYKSQGVRSTNSTKISLQSFNMVLEVLGNAIRTLVHELQFVFSEPTSLPPFRAHSHVIPLLSNSNLQTSDLTITHMTLPLPTWSKY